jgi:hypothetical protein
MTKPIKRHKPGVWTSACGTQVIGKECPDCGELRPGTTAPKPVTPGATGAIAAGLVIPSCICGSALTTEGRCRETGFYPRIKQAKQEDGDWVFAPVVCPFVCPVCRARLDWDGGCRSCHGTKTGRREDWAFPGDRYVRSEDDAHWMLDAGPQGPRMACTLEQNAEGLRLVQAILNPPKEAAETDW